MTTTTLDRGVAAEATPTPRGRLRIAAAPTNVSTLGFLLIVAGLVVVGMVAVMIITTQVGAQSRELSALRKEATTLSYQEAALTSELQEVASPGSLALRAAELGMVPNPFPAFVDLSTGQLLGEPRPVQGDEAPYITRGSGHDPLPTLPSPGTQQAEGPTGTEEA
ncbi:hypothetical protein EII34_08400 [Arachnia propionica]|uniref:Cell division protein FtsL n=1 Tax=Arachnia propionica TaxID=1750 RepID=A0A3P1T6D0_9ACTN|nr:hypothetical protein [Arachnia propionica]MDO5083510.1 hypothetical protein [Arachnia propionica]RRD04939.1 hypothetical protein EII34_08400 [Arachnia propionica]